VSKGRLRWRKSSFLPNNHGIGLRQVHQKKVRRVKCWQDRTFEPYLTRTKALRSAEGMSFLRNLLSRQHLTSRIPVVSGPGELIVPPISGKFQGQVMHCALFSPRFPSAGGASMIWATYNSWMQSYSSAVDTIDRPIFLLGYYPHWGPVLAALESSFGSSTCAGQSFPIDSRLR